jgi:hypothetical protein
MGLRRRDLYVTAWTVYFYETLVSNYKFTGCYYPEHQHRHFHRLENLKSHIFTGNSPLVTVVVFVQFMCDMRRLNTTTTATATTIAIDTDTDTDTATTPNNNIDTRHY